MDLPVGHDLRVTTNQDLIWNLQCYSQLRDEAFDRMHRSPLARSSLTGEIVWDNRTQPIVDNPSLREVDLYSFQGLLKHEGQERFGEQFLKWQKDPGNFEIDSHYPVRCVFYG